MKPLGIRVNGWHEVQLEHLSVRCNLPETTVARLLLLWALENTSNEPPKFKGCGIEELRQALKRGIK